MTDIQRPDISRALKLALNLTGDIRPFLSDGVSPVIQVGPNADRPYHTYRIEAIAGSVAFVVGNGAYCAMLNPVGSGVLMVLEKAHFTMASLQNRTLLSWRAGYQSGVAPGGVAIDITNGDGAGAGSGIQGTSRGAFASDVVFRLTTETEMTNSPELVTTVPYIIPPGFGWGAACFGALVGEIASGRMIVRVYDWTR